MVFWDICQGKKNETIVTDGNKFLTAVGNKTIAQNRNANCSLMFVVKNPNLTQKQFSKPENNRRTRGIKQEMEEIITLILLRAQS